MFHKSRKRYEYEMVLETTLADQRQAARLRGYLRCISPSG